MRGHSKGRYTAATHGLSNPFTSDSSGYARTHALPLLNAKKQSCYCYAMLLFSVVITVVIITVMVSMICY